MARFCWILETASGRLSLGLEGSFHAVEDFGEDVRLGFAVEARFLGQNDTVCDAGDEDERDVFRQDVITPPEERISLGQLHEQQGGTGRRAQRQLGGLTGGVDQTDDVLADLGFQSNLLNGCTYNCIAMKSGTMATVIAMELTFK